MKNMTKAEINKICNEITENGSTPYALVQTSAEMREKPNNGLDVFYADTMPQIVAVFDSKEKALNALKSMGAVSADKFSSPAGTLYDCKGYIVCGLIDEFEEGEDWGIDTDAIIEDSPAENENKCIKRMTITFELFARLYMETADYTSRDMYIGERGWQADWMDELDGAGIDIGKLLLDIWELSKMDIVQLRKRAGLTQVGFAERYSVPYRTVQNWEGNGTARHEPGGYIKMLIAYTLIEV